MRSLITSLLVAGFLVGLAATALGRYGKHHFIPQQQMETAVAAGDDCVLFLGDSRMVAALDSEALHRTLKSGGPDACHVELAIGATEISGMYLTARHYLSSGRHPRLAVIGKVGDSLLGPAKPLRPEEMVGNNAIHLTWSSPSDALLEVPGFPAASIAALDDGFRFLAARTSALGRYQSLVSARIQRLQAALVSASGGAQNRFGALGDMALLEGRLRARAPARLAEAIGGPSSARYGAWFTRLAELLRSRRIPMLVVELPMHDVYRRAVIESPQAEAYHSWLAGELTLHGDSFLDLSRADWVNDELFDDELHLGRKGAALVSTEIARRLAQAR